MDAVHMCLCCEKYKLVNQIARYTISLLDVTLTVDSFCSVQCEVIWLSGELCKYFDL
jgi:hypothetical protein